MIIHKKSNDKSTQGVRHIVAATIYFLTQDVVRQFVQPHAIILPQLSYIIYDMETKKEKCKNCDGSGKIEFDSYNIFDVTSKPKTSIEKCKRCNGTGLKKTD